MRARRPVGALFFIAIVAGCTATPSAADLFPDADGGTSDAPSSGPGESSGQSGDGAASGNPPTCTGATRACGDKCAPLDDPTTGCGAVSCAPCSIPYGIARCATNGCGILQCDSGRADCNGNPADGCETDITTDPSHCGACSHACNGDQECTASGCTEGGADAGRDARSDASVCTPTCLTDLDCQNSCPPQFLAVSCCDTDTLQCYSSNGSTCPSPNTDAGPVGPY